MGVTLSGSQGLSSPQPNGYVVKAYKIRCWLPGYPKLDGFHLLYSWNEKWLVQEGMALVENGLSPPWIIPFLGANGLTSPRVNGYLSKYMKVAFGVGFKMLLFNPLVLSTKDLSRNLKYVVPTGRVKVPAGRYVVPTGKDMFIVSAGRTKVIPAGSIILVLTSSEVDAENTGAVVDGKVNVDTDGDGIWYVCDRFCEDIVRFL
ncbi:hypothetical protein Tco_1389897 [Tanacetum coccineum]